MRTPILGVGSVSACGCGADSLLAALPKSAHPRTSEEVICSASDELSIPVYRADVKGLDRFIPRRALRRIDTFNRMALLASFLAVEDSGVSLEEKHRVGIVFGTGFGPLETTFAYQDTIIDDSDKGASPTLFSGSVHNSPASNASIFMGVRGPCLTITNFARSTTEMLRTAQIWLDRGVVDYVLAGVGDEYHAVMGYALSAFGTTGTQLDPLRFDRCSYQPGEGFVVLLLGRGDRPGVCGTIDELSCGPSGEKLDQDLIDRCRAVLLSSNGDQSAGRSYQDLDLSGTLAAAYSPLYGSLPVGLGFDLALAAVCIREGQLYPLQTGKNTSALDIISQTEPLDHEDRIGCLECSADHVTLVTITVD